MNQNNTDHSSREWVYVAESKREEEGSSTFAMEVADTIEVAQREIERATRPATGHETIENVEWDGTVARQDGWLFLIHEKPLHMATN